ncbi:hypothetical protein N7493_008274 [Penicillium malachiteum]|uniref:Uncharacterized protein n=1 Tax=Penicillium malachiteum TaxID=1324776 RepID=A0AAD6HGV6_9EURO|nr:hypothetical protein N7493_008274 [Penicillium malachiteum]
MTSVAFPPLPRLQKSDGKWVPGKTLQEQESLIHHYIDLLVHCLNTEISTFKNAVDLCRWHNFTTFDIICDPVRGDSFGCLKGNEYHFWITNLFLSVKSVIAFRALTIYSLLAPVLEMLLPQKVIALAKDQTDLSSQKLQSGLEKTTDRPDLITSILGKSNEAQAQAQASTISQPELVSNCAILIVAGSETSASLLSGLTYYMPVLKNPMEIRESFQSYNDINSQAVSTLPYLIAVIEEAFCCYPPVSGIQPRIIPKGGAMIDGEWVP